MITQPRPKKPLAERCLNNTLKTNESPIEIEHLSPATTAVRRFGGLALVWRARRFFLSSLLALTSPSLDAQPVRLTSQAIAEAKKLEAEDARFTIHHAPFGCMDTVLKPKGVVVAGVFLDLGISSPQFDDASRGFRPEQDGPLDLRFDVTRGIPASDYLRRVERDDLARVIETYGETADATAARRVADAVCLARETGEGGAVHDQGVRVARREGERAGVPGDAPGEADVSSASDRAQSGV